MSQDDATVTADVRGPDGPYRVTARYLVGCDGAHSRVRDMAGIGFPGTTYPEVNRLGPVHHARFGDPAATTATIDVPGLGRLRAGFTRTDRGVFAIRVATPRRLGMLHQRRRATPNTTMTTPMTLTELQDSIRRVLGADLAPG